MNISNYYSGIERMTINGEDYFDVADLNNATLYASPYLVVNRQEYTKHIYAGSKRIVSKLGVGLESSIVDPLVFTVEYDGEYGELGTALHEYLNNNLSCTDIKPENVSRNFDLEVIQQNHVTPASEVESDIYFYHTDHLGSSSWITYADGSVTQHMQNLPFGEPFIDQRATSYDIRYKFTGKEMDSETGYQYPIAIGIGARYYNSDISVWLSVDPLADKYPSMSSYMYTAGNPVMLVDPDGRKIIFPSIFTDFGWRFQEDLNKLYQGKYGRALIRSIHLMKTKVTIKDASRWYLIDEKDVLNSKTKGDYPNYWQAKDGYISVEYAQKDGIELANTKTASFLILAHEFVHAKDIASGFVDRLNKRIKSGEIVLPKLDFNNEILEVRAMIYTNKIRQEQGIGEVRTEYNGVKLLKDDGITPIKDYGFNITEGLFDDVEKG